jgi:AcrR family transcriptional regulator
MDDATFDQALIAAAFDLAALDGWASVSVAEAARQAGLPLEQARARFPTRDAILLRFGRLADQMALAGATTDGPPRDRLFDIIMRRFDALQMHRAGLRALIRGLPTHPALALGLGLATQASMVWMLDAAGIGTTGWRGTLRVKGLTAIWLYTLRAWDRDDSADLSGTMAALDRALTRAEQFGDMLEGGAIPPAKPKPFPEYPAAPPPEGAVAL